jgi:hypothetical protein
MRFITALFGLPIIAAMLSSGGVAQTTVPTFVEGAAQNTGEKRAQENKPRDSAEPSRTHTPTIQDNSFLVEEAYNQEFGVVQHISNFQRYGNSKDWIFTFTQEWPVDAQPRHQFSYTLAALHSGSEPSSGAGFGDVTLNYRYQLLGNGQTRVAFAPRFSVLLSAGDYRLGRGVGSTRISGFAPAQRGAHKKTGNALECGNNNCSRRKK